MIDCLLVAALLHKENGLSQVSMIISLEQTVLTPDAKIYTTAWGLTDRERERERESQTDGRTETTDGRTDGRTTIIDN